MTNITNDELHHIEATFKDSFAFKSVEQELAETMKEEITRSVDHQILVSITKDCWCSGSGSGSWVDISPFRIVEE